MKRTRTIIGMLLALMLILSFTLTACGGNADNGGNSTPSVPGTSSTTKPNNQGQGDKLELTVTPATVEMYAGDDLDILMGVVANLTGASVRVSDDGDFDAEVPGTYTITYEAILGDQKATATRTIVVMEALSNLTLEVVKNHMTAGKWEGVLMNFENAQYHALTADFSTTEALTGVFHNTSAQAITVTIGGKMGEVAIVDANGVVIEGRDGANGKLVNAQYPIRANSPGPNATIVVDGEEVKMADNFAKAITVPAGCFAIVVQTGAFGDGFDFDGRGFMAQSVIHQLGNVIRLYWTDTNAELTTYVNQKPAVSGNNKVLAVLGDTAFNLEEAIVAGLVANDDNGTFNAADDVKIEEFTIVSDGGFNINVPGEYTVTLSVTDGTLTTEFTRVVEIKADGIGILKIGENKFYVDMERVAYNQELTKAGNLAFVIYTKEYTGELLANGWGIAFVLDEYGTLVRIYDGASAKYHDAETPDGVQDSSKVTSAGYLAEAFASLQDGETVLAAINNGDQLHRAFAANNKVIGAKVSGLDMEFEVTDVTITINGREFTAAEGKWLYNTAVETATTQNYQMIIFDKNFEGTFTTNGWGCAIVLDQYGTLIKIYAGAYSEYWTVDGKAASAHFDANSYATTAWNDLQDGETLIIFPNGGDNAHRNWALALRNAPNGPSECGQVATLTGFEFAEKPTNDKTITINGKEFTVAEGKWLYNTAVETATAQNYQMIIFDKNFEGTFTTNGWGCAIVLDQYGTLIKIYAGAYSEYWTVDGKAASAHFDANSYATTAWNDLQDGETLIIFPNGGDNAHRNWALALRNAPDGPSECGQIVTLTGFTFKEKEN